MQSVADVMTPFVRTVRVGQAAAAVRDLMAEEGIHAVPIVDDDGLLCGIITAADFVTGWSPTQPVEELMSRPVHTVAPGVDAATAARELLGAAIHHLVVVRGDEPVGMLSSWDLLRSLLHTVERLTDAMP
jgi:CBS domain-containing protein